MRRHRLVCNRTRDQSQCDHQPSAVETARTVAPPGGTGAIGTATVGLTGPDRCGPVEYPVEYPVSTLWSTLWASRVRPNPTAPPSHRRSATEGCRVPEQGFARLAMHLQAPTNAMQCLVAARPPWRAASRRTTVRSCCTWHSRSRPRRTPTCTRRSSRGRCCANTSVRTPLWLATDRRSPSQCRSACNAATHATV